ncbi:uncharacterized protein LOC108817370 isoform X2 [Raphanus sativus]|uniref:Uncharacterized protein LOC108817370 isoform X2 n=1 Tax=Raphanus sativus TaxID=3726 RepID=A0A9W3CZF3_RAPSA|nr:uncharacterized protein LOC108817370 isoform X2 [Raphanus sativus]
MNNRSQNTRSSGSRSRVRAGSVARGSGSRSVYGRSSNHGEGTSGDGPTNNEFRIAELRSNGVENLNDEEIAELFLLEEEEAMSTCISPMLQHYSRYFCKRPTSSDPEKGWHIILDQIYGKEISCQTLIRMSLEAFTRLCGILHETYGLEASRRMSLDESCNISNHLCTK